MGGRLTSRWRVRPHGDGIQLVVARDDAPPDGRGLRLSLAVREPTAEGFPWPAEAEWLTDRALDLVRWAEERLGAEYVASGWRDGHIWTALGLPRAAGARQLEEAARRMLPHHEVSVEGIDDLLGLWRQAALTAREEAWLARNDEVVQRSLAGDELVAVRPVTYTVAVADPTDRLALVDWAKARGFVLDDLDEGPPERPYAVDLVRDEPLFEVPATCEALAEGPGDPAVVDWGAPWHWRRREPDLAGSVPLDEMMVAGFDGIAHEAWFPTMDALFAFVDNLEAIGFVPRLLDDTEAEVGLGCGVEVHRVEVPERAQAVAEDLADLAASLGGRVTKVGPAGIERAAVRDLDRRALPTDEAGEAEAPSVERFRRAADEAPPSPLFAALRSLVLPGLGQAWLGRSPVGWVLLMSAVPTLAWLLWLAGSPRVGWALWLSAASASALHAAWACQQPPPVEAAMPFGLKALMLALVVGPTVGDRIGESLMIDVEARTADMLPAVWPGDTLVLAPRELQAPLEVGALVVYLDRGEHRVARLVGLPGDHVGIDGRGVLVRDGRAVGAVVVEADPGGAVMGPGLLRLPPATARLFVEEHGSTTWYASAGSHHLAPRTLTVGDNEVALAADVRTSGEPILVPRAEVVGPVHSVWVRR